MRPAVGQVSERAGPIARRSEWRATTAGSRLQKCLFYGVFAESRGAFSCVFLQRVSTLEARLVYRVATELSKSWRLWFGQVNLDGRTLPQLLGVSVEQLSLFLLEQVLHDLNFNFTESAWQPRFVLIVVSARLPFRDDREPDFDVLIDQRLRAHSQALRLLRPKACR